MYNERLIVFKKLHLKVARELDYPLNQITRAVNHSTYAVSRWTLRVLLRRKYSATYLTSLTKYEFVRICFSRAVGDRATEPRVAPLKLHSEDENLKEMHLKKIKPKPETKPILRSLRDGLEQLKKTTARERSETRQHSASGFLDRITKLTHGGRSRNPAKKSASFTFAVRPEMAMKSEQDKYSSLEPESSQSHANAAKLPVQRSVSTSVLEVPKIHNVELQADYSRVRDSLTPSFSPKKMAPVKTDEIYSEICDNDAMARMQRNKCPGSHVMARIKIIVKSSDSYPVHEEPEQKIEKKKYVNSIMITSQPMDSIISTEDEIIYNTIF